MKRERLMEAAAAAGILLFYLFADFLGFTTCPFRLFFGLSCAGCGMSRAWHTALSGDPAGAFRVHPLFFLPLLAAVVLVFRRRIPDRIFRVLAGLGVSLMMIVWIVRLAGGTDPVVWFRPEEGLVFKVLSALRDTVLHVTLSS